MSDRSRHKQRLNKNEISTGKVTGKQTSKSGPLGTAASQETTGHK